MAGMLFVLCFQASLVFASEINTMTLDDAVKMALERNRDIKIQELNVEKAEEQLDDMRDVFKYTQPSSVYIPQVSAVWKGYLHAETQQRIAQRELEAKKQQLAVDVKDQYYSVLKNKNNIKLANNKLELAKRNYGQAHVKYNVGIINKLALYAAETELKAAENELADAEKSLQESKSRLATLIGYNGVFNFQLVDDVAFEEADFISLDAVIAQALSQRYEVWAAERSASVAKRVVEHTDNYNVGKIDSYIADLRAGDVQDQIKNATEALYLSTLKLEEAHKVLNHRISTLEEQLRIVKLKNEMGMATTQEYRNVEQQYFNARNELKNLVYMHDVAKTQLKVMTGKDIL